VYLSTTAAYSYGSSVLSLLRAGGEIGHYGKYIAAVQRDAIVEGLATGRGDDRCQGCLGPAAADCAAAQDQQEHHTHLRCHYHFFHFADSAKRLNSAVWF